MFAEARAAEDIGKMLTRERLRLLRSMRERAPESISGLAGCWGAGALECV